MKTRRSHRASPRAALSFDPGAAVDQSIAVGLLLTLVFTALAYGTVEAWSVAIFESIIISLILLWALKVVIDKRLIIRVPAAALPLAALIMMGLAQAVALTGDDGRRLSLSKDVEATRIAVTVLFYLFAAFLIGANFFTTARRLRALAIFLIAYGLALAAFAIVQYLNWSGQFYWLRPNTQTASPFGPFVSHNHFAGYMELLMPIPVALAISGGVRYEMRVFCGFAAALMGVATVASLSRGGMIGMFAAMVFIVVASLRLKKRTKRRRHRAEENGAGGLRPFAHPVVFVSIIAAAIAAGILLIDPEAVIDRVTGGSLDPSGTSGETFFQSRGWIWRDTLSMICANPVSGVGLGAFGTSYPTYSHSDGSLSVSHAHNDYLQVVADCGIIGAMLALWFVVTISRAIARGVRSRDPLFSGLALGGGAGIFAMLVHSLFDFNLQLPSNALLFLLLSAVVSHVGETVAGQDSKENSRRSFHAGAVGSATGVSS